MNQVGVTGPTLEDLKDRFSAGRVPDETDFNELIDVAYFGWRVTSDPLATSGLRLKDGRLAIAPGRGIKVDENGVSILVPDLAGALTATDDGLTVCLADNSGLEIKDDGLAICTGEGLIVKDGSVHLSYGAGLEVVDNALKVRVGAGIKLDSGVVALEPTLLGTNALIEVIKALTEEQRKEVFLVLSREARDTPLKTVLGDILALANEMNGKMDKFYFEDSDDRAPTKPDERGHLDELAGAIRTISQKAGASLNPAA